MSSWPQHLILVGPMGCGKSSIGRAAAAVLGLPFVDTDSMVENATGRAIPRLFAESGEEAFRKAEMLAIQRLLVIPDSVVATGGGAVLREENWEYMLSSGLVVRLIVTPEEALRRVGGDAHRPLLQGDDPLARLRDLQREREPFYERAPRSIASNGRSVQEAALEVADLYRRWRAGELLQ